MPNTEQLFYETEKSSHQMFSRKTLLLKILQIFLEKHLYEIFKNTYFEEHMHMAAYSPWTPC